MYMYYEMSLFVIVITYLLGALERILSLFFLLLLSSLLYHFVSRTRIVMIVFLSMYFFKGRRCVNMLS